MSETREPTGRTMSRRRFLKITAAAGALFAGGRWARHAAQMPKSVSESRLLMGTFINLTLVAEDDIHARDAIAATFAEMERLIALFNWRRPDSPLAILNQSGVLEGPPAELVEVLRLARRYGELTGGAFDVTVQPLIEAVRAGADTTAARRMVDFRRLAIAPERIALAPGMRITLDGIAKGRIIDGATAILQSRGFGDVLVEAGGDLAARGRRPDGRTWQVGITHPRQPDAPLGVLAVSGRAAATSGDYQHAFTRDLSAHHIVDPRRGVSPAELAGVTVLAPTAMDADALSTALMVLGPAAGLPLIERLPNAAALVVSKEMEIMRSADFPAV